MNDKKAKALRRQARAAGLPRERAYTGGDLSMGGVVFRRQPVRVEANTERGFYLALKGAA